MFACGLSVHQKCSIYALTNLLFGLCRFTWIIELFVNIPSPHPRAPTRPSTPEVLQTMERAPTPYSSIVFTLDLHLSMSRRLGARHSGMWLWCAQKTIAIVATLHKFHMKHNKLAFIPFQNWIIFAFDDERRKVCKWWFVARREGKETLESFTKIRVWSFWKNKTFLMTITIFLFQNCFFFVIIFKKFKDILKKMKIKWCIFWHVIKSKCVFSKIKAHKYTKLEIRNHIL